MNAVEERHHTKWGAVDMNVTGDDDDVDPEDVVIPSNN